MSGLFDFNDLSDLPAPLQAKLASGGRVNPNITIYADIVKAASAADVAVMSGRMIDAVAVRMGLPTLSDNAMRAALNGAVTAGLIRKISRQTYGVIEATTADVPPVECKDDVIGPDSEPDDAAEVAAVAAVEAMPKDPLA